MLFEEPNPPQLQYSHSEDSRQSISSTKRKPRVRTPVWESESEPPCALYIRIRLDLASGPSFVGHSDRVKDDFSILDRWPSESKRARNLKSTSGIPLGTGRGRRTIHLAAKTLCEDTASLSANLLNSLRPSECFV